MKNFFKKVAFVLALAMVLSNIGPAARVSAAETPGLKYPSRVLYVGESKWEEYTDSCWTPSQNHDGYKVTYDWDRKDIINVAPNGRITTTGNAIGKAVVTVTYTPIGSGKVETAKFTVKVRRNASDVRLTNAIIERVVEDVLSVGEEIELIAAKSWTTPVSYAKGNYGLDNYMGVVSDQITYSSSNEEVIKIENGKLIAVGAGTATLTVIAYEYGDKTQSPVVEKPYEITVIGGLLAAEQTSVTTVKVSMGQSVADAKADDFSITRVSDTVDFGIKSIDILDDGLTVIMETFNNMNDGSQYKVEYDGKEVTFNATNGIVTNIRANKEVIPYNFATAITIDLLDTNDVVIATVNEVTASDYNVEWTWKSLNGVTYEDKIVLFTRNDTAEFTATYRPGSYDENGNEIGVIGPKTFKITAMDVAVDAKVKSKITNNSWDVDVYSWAGVSYDEKLNIYAEEDKYLQLYITDPDGNDLTQDLLNDYGYYIESSNENLLIIDAPIDHMKTQWDGGHYIDDVGIYAGIHAIKAGTVNALIKNADGKVMFTVAITVEAARRFSAFDINIPSLTLMDAGLSSRGEIAITAKAQNNTPANWSDHNYYITVDWQSGPSNVNYPSVSSGTGNNSGKIYFNAEGSVVGTYRYKVTYEKDNYATSKYVTVIVKDSTIGTDSYRIEIGGQTESTYYTWRGTSVTTEIKIVNYRGGMPYRYLNYDNNEDIYIKELIITNGKYGTTVGAGSVSGSVAGNTVTDSSYGSGSVGSGANGIYDVTVGPDGKLVYPVTNSFEVLIYSNSTITGNVITKAINGTRTVRAVVNSNGRDITVTSSFSVNDYQESMLATVDTTSISLSKLGVNATIEDMIKEALTFKHEGYKEINDGAEGDQIVVRYIKSNISSHNNRSGRDIITSGEKITVTSVVIGYIKKDADDYVEYVVPVNRTFTVR